MIITLGTRTAENAAVYFEKTQAEPIRLFLPQEAKTLDEALASFRASLLPGAKSFGRTILLDGRYVGDVWCYGIDRDGEPQAMVSYCVFETDCWNQGVATEALRLFLIEVREHFDLNVFGAFTYEENVASRRVLEKNGFLLKQRFTEDGAASCYYERIWQEDKLEEMSDFFTARLEGYDEHMLTDVGGCRECYEAMAALMPDGAKTLLDLGCGTGLELDFIFPRFPDLAVTGVDLTRAMLDELRRKHPDKALTLVCGSYFDVDFGEAAFDAAVSFETMHHFTAEKKRRLYERVRRALKPGGVYIECDYMIEDDAEEAFYFAELKRMRREQGLSPDTFVHYDTPLTIAHQTAVLKEAGFMSVEMKLRAENTTILVAKA